MSIVTSTYNYNYLPHVAPLLHGDDPEMVLLAYPDQEGFLLVMKDPPTTGPVATGIGRLEEPVSLLE